MAITHRAIFALSIAFTASVVAYPDLPADIPPRAGFDGPFVGGPFVAFFLPTAAVAIWWVVASLGGVRQTSARDTSHVGAATALFLAAFHVTMLVAYIGSQPWLGRVLGAMVGAFLVATGNALPRTRPNLAWGIRTHDTLENGEVWRRVHRFVGYVRVTMGVAVCISALAGLTSVTGLIVVAVALETIAGLAASDVWSHRHRTLMGVAAIVLAGASPTRAQGIPADRIASLPAMIDASAPLLLKQQHIVGAAIAIVHDGQLVLGRGYGRARLDPETPVDPQRTLFRIGSVTKAFTAFAALQLVDAGALDLNEDVRADVPEVPMRFGATQRTLCRRLHGCDTLDVPGRAPSNSSTFAGYTSRTALQLFQLQRGGGRAGHRGAKRHDV
jgi:uncharacterized membrane protein